MSEAMKSMDALAALGDGTRRKIVELLSSRPRSVVEIARELPVSRPAVSQHLRVLRDCGLVTRRREGTRNIYQLDPTGVATMRRYLDSLWQAALSQYKSKAEHSSSQREER